MWRRARQTPRFIQERFPAIRDNVHNITSISPMLTATRMAQRFPRIVAPYARTLRGIQKRKYASVTALSSLPKEGSQLHGFTLQRSKHVPELELSALHFTHDKTGADYLHVARDDNNNVFSIGFKTNPPDATGVPHILEHVTLCGSEKYL